MTTVHLTPDSPISDIAEEALRIGVHPATMFSAIVGTSMSDARLSGGHLTVDRGAPSYDPATRVVVVEAPGTTLHLFPHEAVALADALRAHAALAEQEADR